jgi:hypothetical protein
MAAAFSGRVARPSNSRAIPQPLSVSIVSCQGTGKTIKIRQAEQRWNPMECANPSRDRPHPGESDRLRIGWQRPSRRHQGDLGPGVRIRWNEGPLEGEAVSTSDLLTPTIPAPLRGSLQPRLRHRGRRHEPFRGVRLPCLRRRLGPRGRGLQPSLGRHCQGGR